MKRKPAEVFQAGRGALDQGDLVEVKPLEFLGNGLGDQSVHGALDIPSDACECVLKCQIERLAQRMLHSGFNGRGELCGEGRSLIRRKSGGRCGGLGGAHIWRRRFVRSDLRLGGSGCFVCQRPDVSPGELHTVREVDGTGVDDGFLAFHGRGSPMKKSSQLRRSYAASSTPAALYARKRLREA